MISCNALINECYQRCSLVGNGQSCSGTEAMAGLNDLRSLISELNGQNLILSDVETVDITKNGGKIRIMEKIPEGWYELDSWPADLTNYNPGCVIKVGNDFRTVNVDGSIKYMVPMNGFDKWPDLIIEPLIDRVITLSRKLGNRYVQLFPGERQLLDSKTKLGLPSFYTCETQLEKIKVINTEYNYEVFIIETDSVQSVQYRVTYLKNLPDLKLNDKLYYSEKIISILEDGVCAKLCLRYKLMDIKPVFDEEFANAVRLLKRANQSNRPMVYEGIGGSYLDSFYDGLCPRSW